MRSYSAQYAASLVFIMLVAPSAHAQQCPLATPLIPATVKRVVDGDTIRLASDDLVRVIGINTPEIARKDKPGEPGGKRATKALSALIAGASHNIYLGLGKQKVDRYGRLLAHLYTKLPGSTQAPRYRNLATELIRQGMAAVVVFPPNTTLTQCYLMQERTPRLKRAGNWRRTPSWNVTDATINAFDGGFAIMRSTVVAITGSKQRPRFLLENGYRVAFKKRAGAIDAARYRNQAVLVRTWISTKARNQKKLSLADRRQMQVE